MTPNPPTALVTGASRGLGAAIAERLAEAGHPVAVNYAKSDIAAQQVCQRIIQAGGRAEPVRGDVTDADSVASLRIEIQQALGPVGILVINATGPQPTVAAVNTTWEDVSAHLAFFVKSPLLLLQAFHDDLASFGTHGRIIHIGSDVVHGAPLGNSGYVAAKSAQLGLARVWAKELAPSGTTVNTVSPGWVPVERHAELPPEPFAEYLTQVPLGRAGTPADVASAVAYLASPEAAFVNGALLPVNGGSVLG